MRPIGRLRGCWAGVSPNQPVYRKSPNSNMLALFQLDRDIRQSLIEGHLFYVEQAKKRLLSQFDDIDAAADQAAEAWLEQRSAYFDPDRHDLDDVYEAAREVRFEFGCMLAEMYEQTRFAVLAGMYHAWDKQLRLRVIKGIRDWHEGSQVTREVWRADIGKIFELLEGFGWEIRKRPYHQKLDACRLIVNVYKHGEGQSFIDLQKRYPEYVRGGLGAAGAFPVYREHTDIEVSDEQFDEFSNAIIAFWRDAPGAIAAPEQIELPGWFEKAVLEDRPGLRG